MLLSEDQLHQALAGLPGWEVVEGAIARTFVFDDFVAAFGFMAKVALLAEKHWHHPDWRNVWNRVEIRLNTHDAGGITEKDTALAAAIQAL